MKSANIEGFINLFDFDIQKGMERKAKARITHPTPKTIGSLLPKI